MIKITKIKKCLDSGDILVPFEPKIYESEKAFIIEYFKKDTVYQHIPSTSNEYNGYNQFAVTLISTKTDKIIAQYEISFKGVT